MTAQRIEGNQSQGKEDAPMADQQYAEVFTFPGDHGEIQAEVRDTELTTLLGDHASKELVQRVVWEGYGASPATQRLRDERPSEADHYNN